ncbi:hypothetical protein BKA62DRAFT_681795 [Auriculariales sp. MPI-PUGE-AT-0066]|nr:hypothetical protein BKA62DRAFT_681795 [Auriculariales sp. MPI-PUGE-AT-0066]
MFARWLARVRTPTYANTGSVARDHLAAERTLLAWLRTSLGFVALGLAIERVDQLDLHEIIDALRPSSSSSSSQSQQTQQQQPVQRQLTPNRTDLLVGSLLGTGMGSVVYASVRYFANIRALERGQFKPAYFGAGAIGMSVAAMAVGVYAGALQDRVAKAKSKNENEN